VPHIYCRGIALTHGPGLMSGSATACPSMKIHHSGILKWETVGLIFQPRPLGVLALYSRNCIGWETKSISLIPTTLVVHSAFLPLPYPLGWYGRLDCGKFPSVISSSTASDLCSCLRHHPL